jgi:NitT/TauT family transport system substrate-binding protein
MRFFTRSLRVAALASVLALTGRTALADEHLTVRMDLSPWGIQAGMLLAQQKGWFKEAGLDVDVQDGTGSISTLQLVSSGQVDVGQVQLGLMAVAKEHGLRNLMSFAGFVRKSDLAAMVDAKEHVTTPKGLIGKKMICFTTSPWAPFIKPYLKANGIGEDQVDVVMVAPTAVVATYAAGQGDGFFSVKPDSEPRVRHIRPVSSLLLADSGIAFPSYGLVATDQTLAAHGNALKKLAQIEVRAWQYIYAGHIDEAVNAIIAQRPNAKLSPVTLREQITDYRPFFDSPTDKALPFGVQSDADWRAAIESMSKAGLVSAAAKPSDYYTNAFVTPAH